MCHGCEDGDDVDDCAALARNHGGENGVNEGEGTGDVGVDDGSGVGESGFVREGGDAGDGGVVD